MRFVSEEAMFSNDAGRHLIITIYNKIVSIFDSCGRGLFSAYLGSIQYEAGRCRVVHFQISNEA